MGYKLAGFDVIGCNEIDPRMMKCYIENHHPKYSFCEPIQEFKLRDDLPEELYNLDILDGSPPCSSFSTAGNREKDWGKEKHFKEGQAKQVLDTLFFDFIDLAKKLQPKVVIAENVKGLLMGEAVDYARRIYEGFDDAGYYVLHYLLNASKMGVPQNRERVFFLCLRKDLAQPLLEPYGLFEEKPKFEMSFNEPPIFFSEFKDGLGDEITGKVMRELWNDRRDGEINMSMACERLKGKTAFFGQSYVYDRKVPNTMTAHKDSMVLFSEPRFTSTQEACCIGSFPQDYNFGTAQPHYLIGMSVPPVMMAHVASEVYEQWLSKI